MAALQYPDSDKRIALLRTLSDLYWNRLAVPSRASAGWIAPLAVVLVGTIVAFVAIALFMPLISLVTSLSS
jgi:type II secretory pathway component PulF